MTIFLLCFSMNYKGYAILRYRLAVEQKDNMWKFEEVNSNINIIKSKDYLYFELIFFYVAVIQLTISTLKIEFCTAYIMGKFMLKTQPQNMPSVKLNFFSPPM